MVSGPGPATGGTRGGELREGVVWVGRESYNSLPRSKEGGARGTRSLPTEDILSVAGPDLVLALVGAACKGAGASGTARHHVEA